MLFLTVLMIQTVSGAKLPDGSDFTFWEKEAEPLRVFHVAQKAPNASDDNTGTESDPWLTINRAAEVMQPGDKVVIHEGVYREWVKPARGGTSPELMITYEAAPGEEVIITGNDPWRPEWRKTRYFKELEGVTTWEADIDPRMFERANTFNLQNFPVQADDNIWKNSTVSGLRRGAVYANGVPLKQEHEYRDLRYVPNCFWVEEDGMRIHLRAPGDVDPNTLSWEITTREQVFAPVEFYNNYIRVKGLKLFHAANGVPIPAPQRGLVSSSLGHHWIIEDCEIAFANTLGIDCGTKWWGQCSYRLAGEYGGHIIRRNYIHDCGVSSMSAWFDLPNNGLLIEDNLIRNCATMPLMDHCENAGIKLHYVINSLIRRNVVMNSGNTASLWLDAYCANTRVTGNLFYHDTDTLYGNVFLEITPGPIMVDNNIVLSSAKRGIYEHDAARNVIMNNLVANGRETAIFLSYGSPERVINGNPEKGYDNDQRICGNIMTGFQDYIRIPNWSAWSDYNVFGGASGDGSSYFSRLERNGQVENFNLEQWLGKNMDRNSKTMAIKVDFDPETLTMYCYGEGILPQWEGLPPMPNVDTPDYIFEQDRFEYPEYRPAMALAPLSEILQFDYFGNERSAEFYQPGAILDMPLDGTPINVDPRHISK